MLRPQLKETADTAENDDIPSSSFTWRKMSAWWLGAKSFAPDVPRKTAESAENSKNGLLDGYLGTQLVVGLFPLCRSSSVLAYNILSANRTRFSLGGRWGIILGAGPAEGRLRERQEKNSELR